MVDRSIVHETVRLSGSGLLLTADRWFDRETKPTGIVVLLHGGGQTRHSWAATGARLGAGTAIVYAVDLRGHGDSDWSDQGSYGLSAHLDDLRSLVEEIKQRHPELPVALVGASLGGVVSLIAAGEDRGLADALVLVDIAVRVESTGSARVRDFMTSAPDGFESLEAASAAISAYNPHRKRGGSLEGLKKNLRLRGGRWHWHWDPRSLEVADEEDDPEMPTSAVSYQRSRQAAMNLGCPVLLVRGRMSDVVSDEGVEEMRELVTQLQVIDVRDAGHMVAGDDNDVFTAGLSGFLERALVGTR